MTVAELPQVHAPDGPDLPDDRGLAHLVERGLDRDPHGVALSVPGPDGWVDRTWAELAVEVERAAARLVGRGLQAGDRLGILGRNSRAWAVADLAAAAVGVITVPLFPTSSAEQLAHVLRDAGVTACLTEAGREGDVPGVPAWSLDDLPEPDLPEGGGWAGIPLAGTAERRAAVRADDIASLVYTSGTTGPQKGCVLTHRNMYVAAAAVVEHSREFFADGAPATLVGLPLAHVFGRTVLQGSLYSFGRTGLVPGLPEMVAHLAAFEPTWLAVVPYALEKMRKGITAASRADDTAASRADDTAASRADAGAAGGGAAGRHPLLGTRLRYVICGGARLDPVVAEFFAGQGVTILPAYGLTESATSVTVSQVPTNRFDAVGRPVPGTTVAIAPDGELLVRGRQCSPGYWPDPRPAEDGWLHTGDLAVIEDDGSVRITGRRKEILVTTGGKNVAPAPLEDRLRLHPLVGNAMVVADDRPYVTALIVLDAVAAQAWAARVGRPADPADPELRAELDGAVAAANASVSRAESIRRWALLTEDFSVGSGQVTPSMKLRRGVIGEAFRAEIEELYR